MINVLRKNQKGLWIVIAMLCIPFVFYFSKSDLGKVHDEDFGHVYGRKVSRVDMQRGAHLFNLARDLGMFSFLQDMVAGAATETQAYNDFTYNHLILRYEAERLGIAPSTTDVANVVKTLQPFRGPQGFDSNKYAEFTQNALPAMGFGEAQIEEVVTDQLMLERLKQVVGSGVHIPEVESKENYERAYGKVSIAVARLQADELSKTIEVSQDETAKYYESHKAGLMSEEKRKVSLVAFGLNEEQKKLAGKERVEVLQKMADRANDFNQALLEKSAQFEEVAAKFQMPIQTTGEFTKAAPDPMLGGNRQLADVAFKLRPEEPNSDATQGGDSFYVLHLVAVDPAKPLTLEEARPKIVEAIKKQKVRELIAARATLTSQKLRDSLKAGTPLDAALAQTGLPVEKMPPFALADPPAQPTEPGKPPQPESPDLQVIKGAVAEMAAGDVSDFIPTRTGGAIVVVEKRDAPDAAAPATSKEAFDSRFLRNKREVAFVEWLRERRREAGVPATAEPEFQPAAG